MKDFFNVGQIVNTHGLKGEVKVYPLTDDVNRFKKLKDVYIDGELKKISSCKLQPNRVILKLEGIDSIEDAVKLKNKYLEVERENAVKLPEGRYFIADIINCEVYDTNEVFIGKVVDVLQTKNNDVYWIKDGKKEVLVPVLNDIVIDINANEQKIIIRPVSEWLAE